ncbi:hypothetical protein F53441_3095 [Fusarium austroafricanum]|uniref:Uncharacterized protein n=1 Tax=Fusarium austroafricanum TaxID=2364996 RepID=A0A8H4KSB8_9HYPO|nr:hypothetical protein F53441_3095 [Fusarium austroafricanum]
MEYLQNIGNQDCCLSGGADGADLEWGKCAESSGHGVIHWTFPGHRSQAPEDQHVRLNDEQLKASNEALQNAAKALSLSMPQRPNVKRLLQRNYYQVAWSQACYAVSFMEDGVQALGGTVWATTMFSQLHPESCDLYFFDQIEAIWLQWNGKSWDIIDSPPRPKGIWAGIGARSLLPSGRGAIRKLMGCTDDFIAKEAQ